MSTKTKLGLSNTRVSKNVESTKRRRDSSKHHAILQATRELVEIHGIRALSLQLIASKAKVSRNVLYNWWDGKTNQIVEEALLPNVAEWPIPDSGNFKQDIAQLIEISSDTLHKPKVLKGFLLLAAEIVREPENLYQTSRYFRAPYAKLVEQILENAKARNEIETKVDASIIAQVISGTLLQFAISKSLSRRKSKTALTDVICDLVKLKTE